MEPSFTLKIKQSFMRAFNVRNWSDWDRTRTTYNYLSNLFHKFFIPTKQNPLPPEFFETAIKRLKLSEEALKSKQKGLLRAVWMMLLIVVLCFFYSAYQFFKENFLAMLLSFVVMCIAVALAFRYHFWFFQIQQRRLGCSLRDWFIHGILRIKS